MIFIKMSRFMYFLNDSKKSLKINVTEKESYRKDYKILEYIRQEDYKKITKAQPYEWHPFLEWWVYVVMAVSLFLGCLIVNYIVKRLNDVRMEERLVSLYEKTSRYTQVQGVLIEQEIKKIPEVSKQPSIGISMIFTKADNQKFSGFIENAIKIHDHEFDDRKVLVKSRANSVINIFKNSNFTQSNILDASDIVNLSATNGCKFLATSASANIISLSRETTKNSDDVIITKKSKSVDGSDINYFKDGNKPCKEVFAPKEISDASKEANTSQVVPPLADIILRMNYRLDPEKAVSISATNNVLSKKPSLLAIPEITANNNVPSIKTSLVEKISSKILNKLSSQREVTMRNVSEIQMVITEAIKDTSSNEERKSDVENYMARTLDDFLQDILAKLTTENVHHS